MSDYAICRMRKGDGLTFYGSDIQPIPASLASLLSGMTPEQLQEAVDLLTCWKAGGFRLSQGRFAATPSIQWEARGAGKRAVRPTAVAAILLLAQMLKGAKDGG